MDAHANLAYSTVATAPSPASSGTSLVVATGEGAKFPAGYFNALVWPANVLPTTANSEYVRCTSRSVDTFTIVRTQENSSARTITVGDQIAVPGSAKLLTDIENYLGKQNGVVASGAAAISAVSVNSGSGVVTYTLAAANPIWVMSAGNVLVPVNFSAVSAGTLTPGALPASGKYRGYGVEIDTNGVVTLSAGGSDQTTQALALANINTVPAAGKVRVADIILLNTAGAYSVSATRDRRPWGQGGYSLIKRTANAAAGSNYNTVSASYNAIDATNLSIRMECTGVPVRITLRGQGWANSAGYNGITFYMDGAAVDGGSGGLYSGYTTGNGNQFPIDAQWDTLPAAGSHLFVPYWYAAASFTLEAAATTPLIFTVEELVRVNANNGTS